MPKLRHLAATFLLLAAALPLAAQRLPEGRERRIRDRDYDLVHLRADLSIDPARGRLEGTAILSLAPLAPLDVVELDAIALEVAAVRVDGRPAPFATAQRRLRIELGSPAPAGRRLEIAIDYAATPTAGVYFQPDRKAADRYWITTYGEGGLAANWLPIYSEPNDKLTSEMVITVPRPYTVVSNGRLVGREEKGSAVTWHWRQERPHSDYLIVLYVGDYERGELAPAFGEIPLAYWVPRGRLEEGAYAFRDTTRMVEFFSRRLGYRYPWSKYDQIVVPDYPIGAMEHTGATGHDEGVLRRPGEAPEEFGMPGFDEVGSDWSADATISHELAHHWFGDDLTCADLSYIWLNESFASYMMMLWDEEARGRERLLWDVDLARRHYLAYVAGEHVIRPLEWHRFDSPSTIYNEQHTYLKGAAVLHMLRAVLGDDAYFAALRHYLENHALGNVVSADLAEAIREATGRNLDWFFADWVTGGGHPRFEVSWRWRPERGVVDLVVKQTQPIVESQDLFRLPVRVRLDAGGASRVETVWVAEATERFLLPAPAKPDMVSFDGEGDLVADIVFEKPVAELAYQARHDALPSRLRALEQMAARYPGFPATREALASALSEESFWGLRAEAARLLGGVAGSGDLLEKALSDEDARVRKGAVLGLRASGPAAAARLREVADGDPDATVAATAVVALAHVDPALETTFLERQAARPAWNEVLRQGAVVAAKELARADLVPFLRASAGSAHNQHVRQAALEAWESVAPDDPALAETLLDLSDGPIRQLRLYGIEAVGRLGLAAAEPMLERAIERAADDDVVVAARDALEEIRRLEATPRR
ncbi:MAG: M1 family metallopeptidase [Holophagales bacterium]|nr:M1 family metallopeptidase [Myxococcales bacterium]MCB9377823.1 M1 family metallopeptidase [Holophagales bacterium]